MRKIIIALVLLLSFVGTTSAQTCNCNDPLNILDGTNVLFFHRTLVLDLGTPNMAVEIFGSWYDNTGSPVTGPVNAMTNGSGMLEFEFFSQPGEALNFDVHYNSGQGELALLFIGSACEPCMAAIPTMGQWAILCLALILSIVGVNTLRQSASVSI